MTCPYLKETDVKLCRISAYRKMIVRGAGNVAAEKCSSPAHVSCPVYRQETGAALDETAPAASDCTYLQQSHAEFCAASPVQRFVPCSDSQHSRCSTESHRYCDVYLGVAGQDTAAGVEAVARLYYSPNHMWLDLAADGSWHVGVDDLLARVMGNVDRVTFVTPGGVVRPAAVLTVNGWDFEMVFPHPLPITAVNTHLRTEPAQLTDSPYTFGWLFEGRLEGAANGCIAGLRHGTTALGWMLAEMTRIAEFAGGPYLADGGTPANVIRQLERPRALQLFHEFFSLARVGSGL